MPNPNMPNLFNTDFAASDIQNVIRVPYGGGAALHWYRPFHGLALSVGCTIQYIFDNKEVITASPGQLVYLPRKSKYSAYWRGGGNNSEDTAAVYCINFSLAGEDVEYEPCKFEIKASELLSAFRKAENAWRKKDVGFLEECYINLYGIIKMIKREVSALSGSEKRLTQMKPALDYIRNNYTLENITAPYLADLCGMSEPYLRKLFEREFSESPMVYIRNMRIKYAAELIASGEYSVTDAAMMSGFNDNAYFSREFKKAMGISPKEYKNSLKSKL